jgi:hypothetical protein
MLLGAMVLALPLWASGQVFRCADPAGGKTLYTDQPCAGGQAVVPAQSPEEARAEADRAEAARAESLSREELALRRERERLELEQARASVRPQPPSETAACSEARKEATFRAGTVGATEEQIRTARANAALACGQPAPDEVPVVQPPVAPYYRSHRRPRYEDDRAPRPGKRPSPNNPLSVTPYPIDVAPYPLH